MPKNRTIRLLPCIFAVILAAQPERLFGQQWTCGGNTCYTTANVGIGTSIPFATLHVNSGTNRNLGILNMDWLGGLTGSIGFDAFNDADNRYIPLAFAGNPIVFEGGNVGIGTTNPQSTLAVNGTITAKEVIVTNTGWSDYVFAPDYQLKPLNEVAAYVNEHHHLPDVPSAAEVEKNGVSVGEMQAKLLAKIEELTLHMISSEQENQELRARIEKLERGEKERIKKLETAGIEK